MFASAPDLNLPGPPARRRISAIVAVLLALGLSVVGSGTASAHTGFESSTPTDGAAIDEPIELITIAFTGEANPVGDKFVALTPEGVLQEPVSVQTLDNKLFSLRFDPALAGGQVGIRWHVQAADAHPIEGAFSFSVNAPAPTTAPAAAVDPVAEPIDAAAASAASLDEFLAVDNSTPGETTATVGRMVGFLGVALGLGAFAFVATALRGRRDEIRQALTAIRVFGVVIVIGAAIEYVGVARIGAESLVSNWSTAPGFATILRVVGGVGLAVGLAGTMTRGRVQTLMRKPSVVRSLSAAVIEDRAPAAAQHVDGAPIVRWTPNSQSWPALGGVALIIASFWFDGHTVSKGFRPLHALVNSVHVAAGAVWVGGVVMMAGVIWSRYRSGQVMRVVELVVRFSQIATIALAAVVAAGGIMAFLVLDTFGELTGTTWGQILLLKTAAVGLAMIGGAYNHFRLLPALESDPESPELLAELRNTVTAEAIMLVFVVVLTAWLVAAAS
jgi:copper transport protein